MNAETAKTSSIKPIYLILIAVLLWSTGGLFIKMTSLDAFAVNLGRSFLGAVVIAAFTYKRGLRLDLFTALSSLMYAGTLSAFVYATKNTTAANAIFLQYTAPIYILILSPVILKERFRSSDLLTVAACLVGMSFFFFEAPNGSNPLTGNVWAGNIAALVSGVFFGVYFILLRHPRSLSKNPSVSVFYGNLFVVALMLPFVISSPPATISALDAVAVIYLGVFQIGLSYLLFTIGMHGGVRAMDASIIGFIEPLFNPVWVFIFLSERPSAAAMFGGVIIITSVALHTIRQNRTSRAAAA